MEQRMQLAHLGAAPTSTEPHPVALRGRWLLLARAGWVAAALVTLGLWVPGFAVTVRTWPRSPLLYPAEIERVAVSLGLSGHPGAIVMSLVFLLAPMLVFAGMALLLFLRRPDDPLALFVSVALLTIGATVTRGPFALQVAYPALRPPAVAVWVAGMASLTLLLYLFPDGRFVPRWTRLLVAPTLVAYFALVSPPDLATALFALSAFPASMPVWSSWLLLGAVGCLTLVGVAAQVYRYRRVSGPVQRQQTKWVMTSWAAALSWLIFVLFLPNLLWSPPALWAGTAALLTVLFLVLIPVTLAVAILRYRLWDIDALINRALVYGALTVALSAVYFGSVALFQQLLRPLLGRQHQLAIVASTLAIAALFQPLRRHIQGFIDRRFYRRKYDAQRTLAAFGVALRDETDLGRIQADLLAAVQETLQPAHASLWLRPPEGTGSRVPEQGPARPGDVL